MNEQQTIALFEATVKNAIPEIANMVERRVMSMMGEFLMGEARTKVQDIAASETRRSLQQVITDILDAEGELVIRK